MVNPNPIQQVLQAEREAGEAIEQARADCEQAVAAARRWAQNWSKRTEARLQKATADYSQDVRMRRQQEAEALREHTAQEITRRRALAESQLQPLVDEVYAQRWPKV